MWPIMITQYQTQNSVQYVGQLGTRLQVTDLVQQHASECDNRLNSFKTKVVHLLHF